MFSKSFPERTEHLFWEELVWADEAGEQVCRRKEYDNELHTFQPENRVCADIPGMLGMWVRWQSALHKALSSVYSTEHKLVVVVHAHNPSIQEGRSEVQSQLHYTESSRLASNL